ncbi:LSU ribosomal protein L22P [Planctomycetales bacterium 10988]|nr:LSU ribosomal protein L22P [Planctomycetales bacterium 10988]
MAYKASHLHARISARKVRPIADMIRGMNAEEALNLLRYQSQRGARMLEKVLRSAIANASDQRALDMRQLTVTEARVDGGPMFRRLQPRARGMAYSIKKRTAHIHVSVDVPSRVPAAG